MHETVVVPGPGPATENLSVAVVIPCHNYGHFLPEAIQSALDQTRAADAILVVDDGSTDDTRAVAETFGPRVRYLRKHQGGPSSARNFGAREVDTDLVVFLDSDDRLDPRFLEKCISALPERWEEVFVYTHFKRFGNAEGVAIAPPYDLSLLIRDNYIHPASLLPRRHVTRLGYDETLRSGLEDWDLYLSLAAEGIGGVLVDEPLLLYRLHGDGVTWRLRRRPLDLAFLRLKLLSKHRALYTMRGRFNQAAKIAGLLVTDTTERYDVARRTRKLVARARAPLAPERR